MRCEGEGNVTKAKRAKIIQLAGGGTDVRMVGGRGSGETVHVLGLCCLASRLLFPFLPFWSY